jgi:hypothetical protein
MEVKSLNTKPMKPILTILLLMMAIQHGFPQNDPAEPLHKPGKFFFGLNYDYIQAEMNLLTMTKHSVWGNQDLGTIDVPEEDIDTINSYMDYTEKINNISLVAGMVLLNKPGGHWYIDGRIMIGFVLRDNVLLNHSSDSADIKIKSEQYSPSVRMGFNFKYLFSEKWGLDLGVNSVYASGNSNKIDENIYPEVDFLDESRDNKYRMSCTMLSLLASYKANNFTIGVGPGFNFIYNRNEYHIVRSDTEDGTTYEDSIETTLRSDIFLNGTVQLGWRISDHFQANAGARIGKDISANVGLIYFL